MLRRVLLITAGTIVVLLGIGWVGLRVPASSFPRLDAPPPPDPLPLPTGLPEPAQRYVNTVFGTSMPRVTSAIAFGRASITLGLTMPARFRIYYDAQHGYYHDMQATWFTLPLLQVHERYLDGVSTIDIPIIGYSHDDPQTNAAANQGFWSETLAWVPAIPFADPRVRWEAVDAQTARMLLPDAPEEEAFTLRFDPETGLLTSLETLRYQDGTRKPWKNFIYAWGTINGVQIPTRSATQWGDDAPWAVWEVEDVVWNVDVSERMSRFGS